MSPGRRGASQPRPEEDSKPHPPERRLQGVFTSQGDIFLVKTKNENKQKTQTNKKTVYTQE